MVVKILSGDIQISDNMFVIPTPNQLAGMDEDKRNKWQNLLNLFEKTTTDKGHVKGKKAPLEPEEFDAFANAISGIEHTSQPGGSSANTLTTLSKLLPGKSGKHKHLISGDMLGVAAGGIAGAPIRTELNEVGIKLIPDNYRGYPEAKTATSFVFQEGKGRTALTYAGNAREIVKAHTITPDLMQKNDVLFMQGSMYEKFDEAVPNTLLDYRWGKYPDGEVPEVKELWLALPTHTVFRPEMPKGRYRHPIASADVIVTNRDELQVVFETHDLNDAIKKLQALMSERDEHFVAKGKHPHHKPPIAFVTCDSEGALLVSSSGDPIKIKASDISQHGENPPSIGAGDNAYAGFFAGRVVGLEPEDCAKIGMLAAGAKMGYPSARMENPRKGIEEFIKNMSPDSDGKTLTKEESREVMARFDAALAKMQDQEELKSPKPVAHDGPRRRGAGEGGIPHTARG